MTIRRLASLGPRELEWAAVAGATAVVAALSWPFPNRPAETGLDPSWAVALHHVAELRLQYGIDFIMTFGPVGWLGFPVPALGATSLVALIATGMLRLALTAILIIEARRVVPLWATALIALLVTRLTLFLPAWETFQVVVFLLAVEAIAGRLAVSPRVTIAAAGVAAGLAVLGKLNVATFVVAMTAMTAASVSDRWWRGLTGFATVAGTTALALWLLAGQSPFNIGAYILSGLEVVAGYSTAMGTSRDPAAARIYVAFAAAVAFVAWLAWRATSGMPRRRRVATALVLAVLAFAEWKTAFTRVYPGFALGTMALAAFAFAIRPVGRGTWLTCAAVPVAMLIAVMPSALEVVPRVAQSARGLAGEVRDQVLPGRLEQATARTRSQLQAAYALPDEILAAIGGRSVHVDPWESAVAYAYNLRWSPLPLFQSYMVWTSVQDGLNAQWVRGPDAPERILREAIFRPRLPEWLVRQMGGPPIAGERVAVTVDGRYRWFEQPAATLAILCRYAEVAAAERWQVLAPDGRTCAAPEPLNSIVAGEGAVVAVPQETRADRFVIVRVHGLEPDLLTRLSTALHKGPEWFVTISGLRYRLVPGTAADGLLLQVPEAANGSGSFNFGAPIQSLSIREGLGQGAGRSLTYEFLSVPLRLE